MYSSIKVIFHLSFFEDKQWLGKKEAADSARAWIGLSVDLLHKRKQAKYLSRELI